MEQPTRRGDPPVGGAPLVDDPARAASIRRSLLSFFERRARDLPWRRTDDPYAVWVSEVMLQQTRVDAVVPYFERWMERFPDVETLAGAEVDDVLRVWQGLGYYGRARRLHAAARVVRDEHAGRLPEAPDALRRLPGVGPYTAGAVASIAFGRPEPAVDGNVRRVIARLEDEPAPTAAALRDAARSLIDPQRPGDLNQALMELGATVCTPRSPACGSCPVSRDCRARAAGTQAVRPAPVARGPVREVDVAVAVLLSGGSAGTPDVLLRRRPEEGLLGGLWGFPETGPAALSDGRLLPVVRHAFTHRRVAYRPRLRHVGTRSEGERTLAAAGGAARGGGSPGEAGGVEGGEAASGPVRWVPLATLGDLPVAVADRRIADVVREALAATDA